MSLKNEIVKYLTEYNKENERSFGYVSARDGGQKKTLQKSRENGGKNRGNLGRNQAPKPHNLPTRPKKIIKEKCKIKLSHRKGRVTTGLDSHTKQPNIYFYQNANSTLHVLNIQLLSEILGVIII